MTERRGILGAGCVVADVNKVIDAYPARDHLAIIEELSWSTGGPALNLAACLARLEPPFPVGVAGLVGDDSFGDFLHGECTRLGIADGLDVTDRAGTSFTDAMVERDGGRRTFFHHSGANALLDPEHLVAQLDRVQPRIVHLGALGFNARLDGPCRSDPSGWVSVLVAARERGIRTNLDLADLPPERLRPLLDPCLPLLDTLIVNELEAATALGVEAPDGHVGVPTDWAAMTRLATGLLERGVRRLSVVHFPAGCVAAADNGRSWRQGSVRMPPHLIRGTTGAGDAFAAGMLLAWHENRPVEACLRLGLAAAAACLTDLTTSGGIGPADRVLADAEALGFRES